MNNTCSLAKLLPQQQQQPPGNWQYTEAVCSRSFFSSPVRYMHLRVHCLAPFYLHRVTLVQWRDQSPNEMILLARVSCDCFGTGNYISLALTMQILLWTRRNVSAVWFLLIMSRWTRRDLSKRENIGEKLTRAIGNESCARRGSQSSIAWRICLSWWVGILYWCAVKSACMSTQKFSV